MKKEGATPDALQRMADRVALLQKKKDIVEEVEKVKKGKAGLVARVRRYVVG